MDCQTVQSLHPDSSNTSHSTSHPHSKTTPFLFNSKHYLRSLRISSTPIIETQEISEETKTLLQAICTKFSFTDETLALGLHFYQTLRHLHSHERFWASSCLIVAGKACELDKNVPYLNRYQRYADKSFSQSDYEQAQRIIFESLGFDLQFSTFISFLDYYLSVGVVSQCEHLEGLPDLVKIDAAALAREFILKGNFSQNDPELLALNIIKQVRVKHNLTPWTTHLHQISGVKQENILNFSHKEETIKELKEVTNAQNVTEEIKPKELSKLVEKSSSKRKYDYKSHFSSVTKSTLKQNSFSASKLVLQSRKVSQPFMQNFSTLNTQLVKRR